MTRENLKKLYDEVKVLYNSMYSGYTILMDRYYPTFLDESIPRKSNITEVMEELLSSSDSADNAVAHELMSEVIDADKQENPYIHPEKGYVVRGLFSGVKLSIRNKKFVEYFSNLIDLKDTLKKISESDESTKRYLDSEVLHFDGEDIIITDPCYIMVDSNLSCPNEKDYFDYKSMSDYPDWDSKTKHSKLYESQLRKYESDMKKYTDINSRDWNKSNYGRNLEVLGFSPDKYITRDTLYGDWTCDVFDKDGEDGVLGGFCADSGQVSVMSLNEVLKYNPDYSDYKSPNNGYVTLIKDFTGDVQIKVDFDREDMSFYVYVEGWGNTNFMSVQSGF